MKLSAAAAAGLQWSPVDLVVLGKAAGPALTVNIVVRGGTTCGDCVAENGMDCVGQGAIVHRGDRVGDRERVDLSGKKDFVSIDIADPCHDVLVEESGFDRATRLAEAASERLRTYRQGVRAQARPSCGVQCLGGWEGPEAAEAAGVAEDQPSGDCW